jgi:hypothetical protein
VAQIDFQCVTIPGTRIVRAPAGATTDSFRNDVLAREACASAVAVDGAGEEFKALDSLKVGDVVLTQTGAFAGGWCITEVRESGEDGRTMYAFNNGYVAFLHFFDDYGWLCTGFGNLEAVKKLELFSK